MKKIKKLELRSNTIRNLASGDLNEVVGGDDDVVKQSGKCIPPPTATCNSSTCYTCPTNVAC